MQISFVQSQQRIYNNSKSTCCSIHSKLYVLCANLYEMTLMNAWLAVQYMLESEIAKSPLEEEMEEEGNDDDVNTSSRSRELGLLRGLSIFGHRPALHGAKCCLESNDLWRRFNELGTEMIITKSGR